MISAVNEVEELQSGAMKTASLLSIAAVLVCATLVVGQEPLTWTTQQDHQNMKDQLGIKTLRPGPSGNAAPGAPNAANYDPEKANPYPDLPDPLTLKNGRAVTTADAWWKQRRPEIVEDFDREVFGRVPRSVPAVTWELKQTVNTSIGGVPVIAKQLVGHVDNASYPAISVDIQMALVTPADAKTKVPVLMMFGNGAMPPSPPAAPAQRRRAATAGAELGAAADRRGLGLRVHQSRQHSGRQRRRPDARHHRAGQQGPGAQAGRLGIAARVGVGRVARTGLPADRSRGGREPRRDRRRLALRQGRARRRRVRAALPDGARRIIRRRRRQAASPQFR